MEMWAEGDRHTAPGVGHSYRWRGGGGIHGSCYDCHENWAPSGQHCNQCVTTECGLNQIVLVHVYQQDSGLLEIKCEGVAVLKLLLSSKRPPAAQVLHLCDLVSLVIQQFFPSTGRLQGEKDQPSFCRIRWQGLNSELPSNGEKLTHN